jgi:hypothetical protein
MNTSKTLFVLALSGLTLSATAQEEDSRLFGFFDSLRISQQTLYNAKLNFGIAQSASSDPGDAIAGIDHEYDDGYVRVDSTGNFGNLTAYWGYDDASQVSGTDLLFHSLQPTEGFTGEREIDDIPGLELEFRHIFREEENRSLGLDFGVGFLSKNQSQTDGFDLNAIEDTYDASLPVLPAPGYRGGFDDFTSLISDIPSRSTTVLSGTGSREFDATLWTLRISAFIEQEFTQKLHGSLHGGLSTAISDVEFSYDETIDGTNYTGNADDQNFLWGAFIGASLGYHISDELSLFASYRYHTMEDLTVGTADREAHLDLSNGYLLQFGAGYRF